ncbi:PaaI family thioesterase [Chloroflexota bacterium]
MAHPLYAEFGKSPYTKLTGIEITRREDGYSHLIMKVTETVLGFPSGSVSESVHGGAIATMVDVGMGGALLTRLKDDELIRTVQLQVNYLAAAVSGILICESKVINKGRKIATVESEVSNEEGLVAKATGTYYISKAKSE